MPSGHLHVLRGRVCLAHFSGFPLQSISDAGELFWGTPRPQRQLTGKAPDREVMQSVSKTANVQPRTGTFPGTVFSARETCCIDCRAFPSNVRSSRVLGRFCLVSCVFVGVVGSVHSCHAETLQGHVSAPSEEGSAKWVSRRVSDQENIVDPEAASEEQEWTGEIEQALSRRLSVGEKSDVTCGPSSQENVEVTAAVGEYTLQASFTCADPFNTSVLPAANEPTHCLQEPEGTSVPIQQVLQVEGSFKESPEKKYTVTLAKMPDREKVIYYKCNGIAAKVCRVAVKMPEKPAASKFGLVKCHRCARGSDIREELVCYSP